MEEDFGGGYLGKGEGNFFGGLVLGGKGNGWKFFGRVERGTLMGIIWGRGGELGGNYLGQNFAGGVVGVMKPKEKKKEIGEVELLTKTIPSGVQVNNTILDNTEIINCHKTITTHEQTDG